MEWLLLIPLGILFWLVSRFSFIRGYRAGAKQVLSEWKKFMNEEEDNNDEHI